MPKNQLHINLERRLNSIREIKRDLNYYIHDTVRTLLNLQITSEVVNLREIRIIGLKRCGNHAIINWIRKQQTGEVWHLNNIQPLKNPYRLLYQHYPKEHLKLEAWGNFKKKDCLLYSYEDWELNTVTDQQFEKKHNLFLGRTLKRYDLIIMRDPFNLLASRLQNNYMTVRNPNKTVTELWLEYAREYLGETNYLQHNKVLINYNLWVTDKTYRQRIASELELEFSDAGINDVKGQGGGSSFDGLKFSGKATEMDVLGRWKHFLENETYRSLLRNQELLQYSEKIFGYIPGTEILSKF